MKVIVLAGGGGTRLWPLSREDFPKQFLNFGQRLSLLQKSVQRLIQAPFIDEVIVATNRHHLELVQEQLEKIGSVKIVVEPCRRNTGPAIGYALRYLEEHCNLLPYDPVMVLPSDHLIEPEELFLQFVKQMREVVGSEKMITFGIYPTKPETGYGYIEIGSRYNDLTFNVARFVEKPDFTTAVQFLQSSQFYWNAGIFMFSAALFWKQLRQHAPTIYQLLQGNYEEISIRFEKMPNVSIDYALMEKCSEVVVCPLDIYWSDVGCWDSVYDAMKKDDHHNVKIGEVVTVDTINSLIIGSSRLVSTVGLEDMLIVETEDALFISKKGESQRVKALMQELRQTGRKKEFFHKKQNHGILRAGIMMTDQQLLQLNHEGFIPGPLEGEREFLDRIARVKKSFKEKMSIPPAHWDWTRTYLKEMFDFAPESVLAFYSNESLRLWQGAAAWIEDRTVVAIQLREGLRKGSYLGIYDRGEVLAHEAVHAARSAFNEVENEEFFAYMTAQNRFHRIFGPILFRPWEVWPFFFMIVLGMFSSVGYLGASLWLGLGLYRLIRQHKKLQKAFKYIVSFLNDPKKARSVLLRLTDLEITLLSEGNDLQEYAKKQQCLRWRLISLAYLKQNSCGDSNMGEVSSPMFESPQV